MQGGEWERLYTILNVKRTQLEDFAKQKNLGKFTNKKGQVTDKEKLMEVIKAYMDDKGITGMTDKFANTFSGRMSTLSGNIKKSFASLMGIAEDGTIKNGSLFENISKGLEKVIKSVNKFSESKGAEKLGSFLGKIGDHVSKFIDYCSENPDTILTLVKAIAGFKVAKMVLSPLNGLIGLFGSNSGGLLNRIINLATKGEGLSSVLSILSSKGLSACSSIARLSPAIAGLGVTASAVMSFINKDGFLHKTTNNIGNAIAGNSKEEGNLHDYASESVAGWKLFGLSGINTFAKIIGSEGMQRWVNDKWRNVVTGVSRDSNELNGVYALTDDQKDQWYGYNYNYATIENSSKKADYAKSNISAPTINFNVDKIEKTADVDEIMREATKQYIQYYQTRQALV